MNILITLILVLILPLQMFAQDKDNQEIKEKRAYDAEYWKTKSNARELIMMFNDYVAMILSRETTRETKQRYIDAALRLFVGDDGLVFKRKSNKWTQMTVIVIKKNQSGTISIQTYPVKDYLTRLVSFVKNIDSETTRHRGVSFLDGEMYVLNGVQYYDNEMVCVEYMNYSSLKDLDSNKYDIRTMLYSHSIRCRDGDNVFLGNIIMHERDKWHNGEISDSDIQKAKLIYERELEAKEIQGMIDDLIIKFCNCVKRKSRPGLTPESHKKNIVDGCSVFLGKGDSCVVDNEIFVATITVDGKPQSAKDFFADSAYIAYTNVAYKEVYVLKPDDVEKIGDGMFLCNYRLFADTSKRKQMYSATNLAENCTYVAFDNVYLSTSNIPDEIDNDTVSDGPVYFIVEDMPQFPGGETALRKYIQMYLLYPREAMLNNISGTVYVRFIINENGSISNVEVLRGVHPLLDREAVRIIKSLPRWKPGSHLGRSVKCLYSVPVKFSLE